MAKEAKNYGSYCTVNGVRIELEEHETDFSIDASAASVDAETLQVNIVDIARQRCRAAAKDHLARDKSMSVVRKDAVAHHIYIEKESNQELLITDRVYARVRSLEALQQIKEEYNLASAGMMGDTHVLKVTNATGQNAVKTANMIDERDDVEYCSPQLMLEQQRHQTSFAGSSTLFRDQWYMTADLNSHPDIDPRSDIQAPEAWQITMGDPNIVIAVMDDGVDLGHPAFAGKPFHSQGRDFASSDNDPSPGQSDFHGTPVASIAAAKQGTAMIGVAPNCTILPPAHWVRPPRRVANIAGISLRLTSCRRAELQLRISASAFSNI